LPDMDPKPTQSLYFPDGMFVNCQNKWNDRASEQYRVIRSGRTPFLV
jgi:hypothetical protein